MRGVIDELVQFGKKVGADGVTTLAAAIAYSFFLSLFPLIFALFALTGIAGGDHAFELIMSSIARVVPPETARLVGEYVAEITANSRPAVLSLGIIGALWTAAGGLGAVRKALSPIYGIRETGGPWKRRLLGLGVLVACALLFIAAAILILAGPELARPLRIGALWKALRWPAGYLIVVFVFWILYYFLPSRSQRERKGILFIGAGAGALLWLLATFLFQLYVNNFGKYDLTYGTLGAAVVLLVWLYITALAILLGGGVAAWLEDYPHHESAPG